MKTNDNFSLHFIQLICVGFTTVINRGWNKTKLNCFSFLSSACPTSPLNPVLENNSRVGDQLYRQLNSNVFLISKLQCRGRVIRNG